MIFEVLTLFPEGIEAFASQGLLGKAVESGRIALHCTNYRDFTDDPHRKVDDLPYGGGAGMVMGPQPVVDALAAIESERGRPFRVLLSPSGRPFTQADAHALAQKDHLALLCGRYEGIDDRVRERYVDACFSLGDFVLNGGEVAALAIIEAVARLREGVLGNPASIEHESFAADPKGLSLEHPQYTRPASFRGLEVPKVLTGGDHAKIEAWRRRISVLRTWLIRPELKREASLALPKEAWLLAHCDLCPTRCEYLQALAVKEGWSFAQVGAGSAGGAKGVRSFNSLKTFVQRQRRAGPVGVLELRGHDWISQNPQVPALPDLWEPERSACIAGELQWSMAMDLLFGTTESGAKSEGSGTVALYCPADPYAPPDSASAKVDLTLGVAAAPAGIDLALCQRMIESPESHTPWEAMCARLETLLARHKALGLQNACS